MTSARHASLAPSVIYRRLLSFGKPYWGMFIVAAIAMAIYAATDTGFAILMNNFIKTLDPTELNPQQELVRKWLPLAILSLFILRGVVAFLSAYYLGWIGRQVITILRGRAFAKFLTLPTRFFDKTSAGELL